MVVGARTVQSDTTD